MTVIAYTEILLKICVTFSPFLVTIYVKDVISFKHGSEQ
jgi:hypothetical protein